jgi:squalene synthase HpnC
MFTTRQIEELTTADGGSYFVGNLTDAYDYCRKVTNEHYENFPVASLLMPKKKQKHVFPVYAFARLADDISDENPDMPVEKKEHFLNELESIFLSFNEKSGNPILLALRNTIYELKLPELPFIKLLNAFRRDVFFSQAESYEELLDYCNNSADPVGELILRLFEEYDEQNSSLSDKICTALQLANFWQDISIDRKNGRCYIPAEILRKYNLPIEKYLNAEETESFRNALDEVFDYTGSLFDSGRGLIPLIKSRRLRTELKLTILGGEAVLKKCRSLSAKLFYERPKLTRLDFFLIFVSSFRF